MLEVSDLWKRYGYVRALRGLSFHLEKGEVLGFVGPNGAGKTTTIKSIVGLVHPDRGRILVDGRDPRRDKGAKKKIGYVPELPEAPGWARACELLEFLAMMEGVSKLEARRVAKRALEEFGVDFLCNRRLREVSKGQRKRILLAQAFMTPKDYLLLDEPVSGLDPEWVARVRDLVAEQASAGAGVLVSSHILRELEDVANRFVIIARGSKVFEGTTRELAEAVGMAGVIVVKSSRAPEVARLLESLGAGEVKVMGSTVRAGVPRGKKPDEVLRAIMEAGLPVEGFEYREASLEEAYLRLVRGGV